VSRRKHGQEMEDSTGRPAGQTNHRDPWQARRGRDLVGMSLEGRGLRMKGDVDKQRLRKDGAWRAGPRRESAKAD